MNKNRDREHIRKYLQRVVRAHEDSTGIHLTVNNKGMNIAGVVLDADLARDWYINRLEDVIFKYIQSRDRTFVDYFRL